MLLQYKCATQQALNSVTIDGYKKTSLFPFTFLMLNFTIATGMKKHRL